MILSGVNGMHGEWGPLEDIPIDELEYKSCGNITYL